MNSSVVTGLEQCVANPPQALRGEKFGLLMNQASVDRSWNYAVDVLQNAFPGQLVSLFSPQHGLWGEQQANMIETQHHEQSPWGIPIHSLYSETRAPTDSMLEHIKLLVIDLQDVGTRVYTYAWTVVKCLQACARNQVRVVILDRPNPLGGKVVEGPHLDPGFFSFVGMLSIPMRHAMTLGQLAKLAQSELCIDVDLQVVDVIGCPPEVLFNETGLPWAMPSPNLPRWQSTLLYPGMVLLEGTNLSEGRGTTVPFEVLGAPFIDPIRLTREVGRKHPGVCVRPIRFRPTFDKWSGQSCGGVALQVVNPREVRSYQLVVDTLSAVHRLWPDDFEWLPPPYEYETEKMPIDILSGNAELRLSFTE